MSEPSNRLPAVGGAPPGNENRVRHGVFSWATSGRVPTTIKGGKHLRNVLRAFRSGLLVEVERVKSRPATLHEQALISSAVRHEGRARLLERLLAESWDKMSVPERVSVAKEVGSATDSRDKAIKAIGLDQASKPMDAYERMMQVFQQTAPANGQQTSGNGAPSPADAANQPEGCLDAADAAGAAPGDAEGGAQ